MLVDSEVLRVVSAATFLVPTKQRQAVGHHVSILGPPIPPPSKSTSLDDQCKMLKRIDMAEARGGRIGTAPLKSVTCVFSTPLCHHRPLVFRLCVTCMSPGGLRGGQRPRGAKQPPNTLERRRQFSVPQKVLSLADRWAQQHDRSYSAFPIIGFIMHASPETLRWNAGAILAGDVGSVGCQPSLP